MATNSDAPTDEPDDVGDAEKVKTKRNTAKFRRETELSELKAILGTEGGRKFIWRLLTQCRLYDPVETMTQEGQRRIGLWTLHEILAADGDAYMRMMKEHTSVG